MEKVETQHQQACENQHTRPSYFGTSCEHWVYRGRLVYASLSAAPLLLPLLSSSMFFSPTSTIKKIYLGSRLTMKKSMEKIPASRTAGTGSRSFGLTCNFFGKSLGHGLVPFQREIWIRYCLTMTT